MSLNPYYSQNIYKLNKVQTIFDHGAKRLSCRVRSGSLLKPI